VAAMMYSDFSMLKLVQVCRDRKSGGTEMNLDATGVDADERVLGKASIYNSLISLFTANIFLP
jgi:hypothetical protein